MIYNVKCSEVVMEDNLSLIVLDNCKELGKKVQKNLNIIRNNNKII